MPAQAWRTAFAIGLPSRPYFDAERRRELALTLEWAVLHRGELLEDWQLCATRQTPKTIPPLD